MHYVLEKKDLKFLGWYLNLASSCSDRSSFHRNRRSDCDLTVGHGATQNSIMHEILNARTKSGSSSLEIVLGLTMDQKMKEDILELLIRHGAQNVGVKKNINSFMRKSTKNKVGLLYTNLLNACMSPADIENIRLENPKDSHKKLKKFTFGLCYKFGRQFFDFLVNFSWRLMPWSYRCSTLANATIA